MENIKDFSPEFSPANVSAPPPPPPLPVKSNSSTKLKKPIDLFLQKCNSFASKAKIDPPENVSTPPSPPPLPVKSYYSTKLKKPIDLFLQKCNSFASKGTIDSPENVSTPPSPPPPPVKSNSSTKKKKPVDLFMQNFNSLAFKATRDSWDRMFDEAHGADVLIHTDGNGLIYAHSNVIGMASPVIRGMMKQDKRKSHRKSISILGVPHDAVRVFIRFLYSSCYEKQDMEDFALHLLVLSHIYVVPHLKRLCETQFEDDLLNKDNVVDVFPVALLCDAPRLGSVCHRMILKNFEEVSTSDGWQAMKQSHPSLQKQLLRSVAYEIGKAQNNFPSWGPIMVIRPRIPMTPGRPIRYICGSLPTATCPKAFPERA